MGQAKLRGTRDQRVEEAVANGVGRGKNWPPMQRAKNKAEMDARLEAAGLVMPKRYIRRPSN